MVVEALSQLDSLLESKGKVGNATIQGGVGDTH